MLSLIIEDSAIPTRSLHINYVSKTLIQSSGENMEKS